MGCSNNIISEFNLKHNINIKKYTNGIKSILELNGKYVNNKIPGYLLTCDGHGFFHIWNSNFDEVLESIRAHLKTITDIFWINDEIFLSASTEGIVRLWNINEKKKIDFYSEFKLNIQLFGIKMLYKNDNENFAVLYKNGIKIYSLNIKKKTFDEVNNLTIKNEINIKTNNNKIIYNNVIECLPKKKIAFSNIYTISIWDYDNKDNNNNLITLEGHTKSVTSLLLLKDEKLLSGSEDKKIYLWNIEKKYVLKELNGHKGAVLSMYQINEGNLISGDQYCLIYIWSLDLNGIIQKIVAQGSIIKIEQLKNRDLVTYSSDNEIKIWGYID